MIAIFSHSKDPYFNLAAEEYLLKHSLEDFFLIYINNPSVVIGKHQNAQAEVDVAFLEENGITLARRISGGGAVYHDHGNINYSFITNEKPGDYVRFKTYTQPVIESLAEHGLEITLGKRNELLLGDKKISGTASHVFKNRVIHHGTLLFDTKLDVLSKCLYVNNSHYDDKAVKSVRSEVTNLKSVLAPDISMEEFASSIFNYISSAYFSAKEYILNTADNEVIDNLVREKFSLWDWNYGYSPKYTVNRIFNNVVINTEVLKGKIALIDVGERIEPSIKEVLQELIGERHERNGIIEKLKHLGADTKIVEAVF